MSHVDFFGCKYPIVCLPMNGVSDANLAIAVSKAGAFPSLSLPNYFRNKAFLDKLLFQDLKLFQDKTNSSKIMISLTDIAFCQNIDKFYHLASNNYFSHIELMKVHTQDTIFNEAKPNIEKLDDFINLFQKMGIKFLYKALTFNKTNMRKAINLNGVIFKGPGAAGKYYVDDRYSSLIEMTAAIRKEYPTLPYVVSGGISNSGQIKILLSSGAMAVGLGTAFAICEESCIAKSTKLAMIESTDSNLSDLQSDALNQRSLIFSNYEGEDDSNHTKSLHMGINGEGGHIFVGKGITDFNKIMPVKDMVERMVGFEPIFTSLEG